VATALGCLAATGQFAFGQAIPAAASAGPTPKATLVDGKPALSLDYGDGMGFLIVYTKFHDKPTFRFSISHPGHGYECGGFLWAAKDEIAYSSDPSANQKVCVHMNGGLAGDLLDDLLRQFTNGKLIVGGNMTVYLKTQDVSKHGFHDALFVHDVMPSDNWFSTWKGKEGEAASAGKIAGPWLQLVYNNFDDAVKQFTQATAGTSLPLTAGQSATILEAEKSGQAAEQARNFRVAFDAYVSALTALPTGATGDEVDSLRNHLIRVADKLNPSPVVPEDAARHLAYALAAMTDWKSSGDTAKLSEAVDELNQVARLAPWRPEVYYNLGIVLEGQNQYAAAARNLKLYLLAAPNSPDADAVQQKIYQLEYKAGAR